MGKRHKEQDYEINRLEFTLIPFFGGGTTMTIQALTSIKANVTINQGEGYLFPEQTDGLLNRTGNNGVCFSGGGTRALSAAIGQLRALRQDGYEGVISLETHYKIDGSKDKATAVSLKGLLEVIKKV